MALAVVAIAVSIAATSMMEKSFLIIFIKLDGEDTEHDRQAIEYRLISNENLVALSRVWPKLDARNRWILESHYIQEKPPDEMARELGIKPESLRMVLSRARKAAYRLMEDELNIKK